jgi:hypothetical protein
VTEALPFRTEFRTLAFSTLEDPFRVEFATSERDTLALPFKVE